MQSKCEYAPLRSGSGDAAMIRAPGATKSGFKRPSRVGPRELSQAYLVAIVRLANRDGELSCSWSPDGLEVRALVAGSYHDRDTILNEIVDFTTDGIRPVRGKIRCNREVQDLHAKLV